MYAFDFLHKGNQIPDKVFISGDNECVKNLVLQKVCSLWAVTEKVYVTKPTDLKISFNQSVFGFTKVAYIFSGKAEPKKDMHYIVRLSKSAITKKYKDMGFLDIVCSSFFPNQVEDFCKKMLIDEKVNVSPSYAKFLCVTCNYEMVSIINIIRLLSFLNQTYVGSLSYQDFTLLCGTLSISDESTIISYFMEGNYSEFLSRLQDGPTLLQPVLRGLVFSLLKARSVLGAKNPTWFQRKLLACVGRMELYGLDRVILELQRLADSFLLKPPQVMLRLNMIIKSIKGDITMEANR